MLNSNFDLSRYPNEVRQEVLQLQERVQALEQELATARHALLLRMKEAFARQPLPYSEEELRQMIDEEQAPPLEAFIGDLEDASGGSIS